MRILAMETSCDETAIAVLEFQKSRKKGGDFALSKFKILSNIVSSQIKLHAKFGGVVPNLARREHQRNLSFVLTKALKQSELLEISKSQILNYKQTPNPKFQTKKLQSILERESELLEKTFEFLEKHKKPKIDLIAVTNGPGLEPALWVGINFAKALAFAWNIPIIGINHLEGHIFSVFLKKNREDTKSQITNPKQIQNSKSQIQKINFPILALIVSGGHTELILMKKWLNYKIIGGTRDDAAGEAFDKVARILGLGYPGGPTIAVEAAKFLISNPRWRTKFRILNSEFKIKLPRPMLNTKDFDFSFSGLKTAVLYLVKDLEKQKSDIKSLIPEICHEFQEAVIDVLVKKTLKAAEKFNAKTIILCGGVSANKELRQKLGSPSSQVLMPEIKFSGDNAAMIALAAYFESQKNPPKSNDSRRIKADGNLKL